MSRYFKVSSRLKQQKSGLGIEATMSRLGRFGPEMGIDRENLSAIVIGDNFLPIIVIAQDSLDLSITDIAFVKYFVIADELSR